jgi:hypothetical protein
MKVDRRERRWRTKAAVPRGGYKIGAGLTAKRRSNRGGFLQAPAILCNSPYPLPDYVSVKPITHAHSMMNRQDPVFGDDDTTATQTGPLLRTCYATH